VSDLELVTTIELLDELEKRFDHGAIGMLREDGRDVTIATRAWGNGMTAAGLADRANRKALDSFMASEQDADED
jgi:hypothetical protein